MSVSYIKTRVRIKYLIKGIQGLAIQFSDTS
jgi:hypothetical protein